MDYILLIAGGIAVGLILGLFVRRSRKENVGLLHVHRDEFPEPMLFLELQTDVSALYQKKEVSLTVVIDPQD